MQETKKSEDTDTTSEQLNGFADQTHRQHYSEQTEAHDIPDSPFTAVRMDKNWCLLMGKYLVKDNLTSLEETIKASRMNWETIMSVMAVMIERYYVTAESQINVNEPETVEG